MSIKSKAINSGKWVTISTVVQTLIQFAQIAVLARLLDSTTFGIVGMSAIFIAFFSMLGDLGFTNSIIHKQETDQSILSTVYFVNILLGLVMFLLICLLCPLVVSFYHEPRLYKVITRTALVFLITSLGSIYSILLKKEVRFKEIAIIDISGNGLGFPVTVFLAYKGFAELALVYGGLVSHSTRTLLEIYFGRDLLRPKLYFKIREIKDHLKFGMYNFGEAFFNFIQGNWDNIIIGKILGARYLGIYTLALQLGYYPISKLNPLILRVAYPLIAKLKDDVESMKRTYLKILDILSYFNYPLLAGLFITVESIVPLVYGPHWQETFPLIKIFVFVGAASCLSQPLFTIAYSKGKPQYLFYLTIVSLTVKVILVYVLGKYWSVVGVALALLFTELISLTINFFIVHFLIGNFFKEFLRNLFKPVAFCLALIIGVYFYKLFFGYVGIYNTIAEIAIGGAIYIILTFSFKYTFADVKDLKRSF
ncbi:MAG: MOP flippase family protein [Bacteroidota bacterium]